MEGREGAKGFAEAVQMRWLMAGVLAAGLAAGQPRVGVVEVFGARRVPAERIRKVLGVAPGDPLPKSKGEAEERIEGIDGVVRANLEAWCCEEGRAVLYVGIEERGGTHFELRPAPADDSIALPEEVMAAYGDFAAALGRATAEGDLGEDLSRGHSLMQNVACHSRTVDQTNPTTSICQPPTSQTVNPRAAPGSQWWRSSQRSSGYRANSATRV